MEARAGLQLARSGRSLRRHDLRQGPRRQGPRRHHRGLRRDVPATPSTGSGTPTWPRGARSSAASRPTLSGTPKYNAHANDIDFQIEADFIGLMAPGLPQCANEMRWRAGRVMNYGDGIYGGMFVSGMYAAAFFENDPAQGGGGRPGLPAAQEPLCAADHRRARLVASSIRTTGRRSGSWSRRSGTSASLARTARCSRSTSTPS